LELIYATEKIKQQCTSIKAANKLFGGDSVLGRSLLARINALEQAETIKDIMSVKFTITILIIIMY